MGKSIFLVIPLLATTVARPATAARASLDTAKIEELTGAKGKLDEKEGAFKVAVPRSDLSVSAAGVRLTPPMGLTSWAAFKRAGTHTMVMGDMVLLEDQVNPVMSAGAGEGTEGSARHAGTHEAVAMIEEKTCGRGMQWTKTPLPPHDGRSCGR